MPKFKHGQTVEVKSIYNTLSHLNDELCNHSMYNMIGKNYTIDDVMNDGNYIINGWVLNEKDLIRCKDEPQFNISKLLNGGEAIVNTDEYDDVKNKNDNKRDCSIVNKPSIISINIVQYFRRWDINYNQISNTGGLTVLCELDYFSNTISVYPAFCSILDNFDKMIGLNMAEDRKKLNCGIIFKFDHKLSIYNNIRNALLTNSFKILRSSYREDQKMLNEFQRCLIPLNDYKYSEIFEPK